MDGSKGHFDDPVLKSAVRRCWADECAPAELHQRMRTFCSCAADGDGRANLFRVPSYVWALSAAALVALVIGIALHPWSNKPISTQTSIAAINLPSPLQEDLVSRHDLCCAHGDHQHIAVSKDDDLGIVHILQQKLGRAVLVARPTEPGWTFRGAAVCPVGTVPSGHLVFARGTDTLSVFSLPTSVAPGLKDGQEFTVITGDHMIAGFQKNGALFCLVAFSPSGAVTTSSLDAMRTQMEPAVEIARNSAPESVQFAELLRPVAVVCQNRN